MSESRRLSWSSGSFARGLQASLDPFIVVRALRSPAGEIEDFSYVEISQSACEYLGRTREDMLARTMREALPGQFASQLVSFLTSVVVTGLPAERRDVPFLNSGTQVMGRLDIRAAIEGDLVVFTFRDLAEMRDAVDRYRLLLENASDVVVRTNREGVVEWICGATVDLLGYQPDELQGTLFSNILHPEDLSVRLALRDRVIAEGTVRFRSRLLSKNGGHHTFGVLAHRVSDVDGVFDGVVAGLHLIDAEVASEDAARLVDARFRLMATYGTDVVSLERHGVVEWVSPYVGKLLDFASADVVGRALVEFVHPDDRASLQAFYRVIEDLDPLTLTLRMRTADSTYRWVSMRSREVYDDDTGEMVRVSSWRDAQDDVASQRALIASENRYRILAENSTDVVMECDDGGVIRWASPSAELTLGWRLERVVGTRLDGHVVEADRDRVGQQREAATAQQDTRGIEVRYVTPAGNVRWMLQRMRVVRGIEGMEHVTIIGLHDIDDEVTARFAAEETEARFHLLADNATDVVYKVDLDGQLIWASPSMVGQLGWQVADIVGHNAMELIFPEDQVRVLAWRRLIHLGETLDELTIRVRHSNGHFVWMRAEAQPVRDDEGHVIGIVVALHNCDVEIVTARALRTISAGTRVLIREQDSTRMLHEMCQVAVDEGGYSLAWYGRKVFDENKSVAVIAHSLGNEGYLDDISVTWGGGELGQGPGGRAIRFGQTSTIANIDTDPAFLPWRERAQLFSFQSVAAIPVVVNGAIDGAWWIYALETRAFTPAVLEVLEDLALEIGFGLGRADLSSN